MLFCDLCVLVSFSAENQPVNSGNIIMDILPIQMHSFFSGRQLFCHVEENLNKVLAVIDLKFKVLKILNMSGNLCLTSQECGH